jgi:hypothetical protein
MRFRNESGAALLLAADARPQRKGLVMVKAPSHSGFDSSTISQPPTAAERSASGAVLDARWRLNRQRIAALRALTNDLERHPAGDEADCDCIVTVVDVLLHGSEAELSRDDLRYLAAIGVPPELIRGSTTERADA